MKGGGKGKGVISMALVQTWWVVVSARSYITAEAGDFRVSTRGREKVKRQGRLPAVDGRVGISQPVMEEILTEFTKRVKELYIYTYSAYMVISWRCCGRARDSRAGGKENKLRK